MSKHHHNIRQPIIENGAKLDKAQRVRKGIGQQIKMDMDRYIEAYPDKQLMVINDLDGDVQRWLDAGAEPIPAMLPDRKVFKGLNDKNDSEWVKFIGGETRNGGVFYAYGLMMDKDSYQEYKLDPEQRRIDDIKQAMRQGVTDERGNVQLGTYAPTLPDGTSRGYNEIIQRNGNQ